MLEISNVSVMNFENAIRGMRNPLNSWEKSDSKHCPILKEINDDNYAWRCAGCKCENVRSHDACYIIGENDIRLAQKLCKAGSDHRKFLRQILVSVDIKAPLYWWKEFDTYKVATVANSCSTMHKIHAKEFTLDDFSHEKMISSSINCLKETITTLNYLREDYLDWCVGETHIEENRSFTRKDIWYNLIQLLPSSYNQLRTVTLNYETLINIYHARKHHKLDEWHIVCDWIETLPYAKELIVDIKD